MQAEFPQKRLTERKVRDLVDEKRRLVEVPYTATLAHTINTLVANRIVAVPVAAPPGLWIGAGGSMIMESDKQTGAVRKHYIGMITMLDILAHIAGDDDTAYAGEEAEDIDRKLSVPVSTVIGHSLEGLSLWTLHPNTNILDCMEVLCKGIHRAMVPLDSHMENISGVELMESASCYRMLTQMDVVKFIKAHDHYFHALLSRAVRDVGAFTNTVFAVSQEMRTIDVIKCIRNTSLQALPIVDAPDAAQESPQLINGYGRKLVGTFSATDLKGCPISQLRSWLQLNVMEFLARVCEDPHQSHGAQDSVSSPRLLVTCQPSSTMSEVINKVISQHVHRVWVTNEEGTLLGLISLTDIIRVMRAHAIAEA